MFCNAYCTHGGVCNLDTGHEGLHSASGYCEWEDRQSISEAEADQKINDKGYGSFLPLFKMAEELNKEM